MLNIQSRSPYNKTPRFLGILFEQSSPVCLASSACIFLIGLVLFSWSSGQSKATSVITVIITAVVLSAFMVMSAWFAGERWVYHRYHGQKWLHDVLSQQRLRLVESLRRLYADLLSASSEESSTRSRDDAQWVNISSKRFSPDWEDAGFEHESEGRKSLAVVGKPRLQSVIQLPYLADEDGCGSDVESMKFSSGCDHLLARR